MNKVANEAPFIQEYNWEICVDPNLFWVIDHKTQQITHSLNMAAIAAICLNKGTKYRVIELTEIDEGDGVPVGSANTIEIVNADVTIDESIEIIRQHDEYLKDLHILTNMKSSNMFPRRFV